MLAHVYTHTHTQEHFHRPAATLTAILIFQIKAVTRRNRKLLVFLQCTGEENRRWRAGCLPVTLFVLSKIWHVVLFTVIYHIIMALSVQLRQAESVLLHFYKVPIKQSGLCGVNWQGSRTITQCT